MKQSDLIEYIDKIASSTTNEDDIANLDELRNVVLLQTMSEDALLDEDCKIEIVRTNKNTALRIEGQMEVVLSAILNMIDAIAENIGIQSEQILLDMIKAKMTYSDTHEQ